MAVSTSESVMEMSTTELTEAAAADGVSHWRLRVFLLLLPGEDAITREREAPVRQFVLLMSEFQHLEGYSRRLTRDLDIYGKEKEKAESFGEEEMSANIGEKMKVQQEQRHPFLSPVVFRVTFGRRRRT